MTSGPASGGNGLLTRSHHARHAIHARDLNSLSAGSSFKRSEPLQAIFDCLAMLAGFLLVSVTGIGIAFAMFVALFVRIP